jgi:dipeptidyl-peptidase-3
MALKLGELERLGPDGMDYLVLGVEVQGFEALTPRQRVLAYHLYRAAVAGNAIFTLQSHRHALEILRLMEALHLRADLLEPEAAEAVHEYLKYLWINHGHYDHDSHTKFVPHRLTPEMLRQAARRAADAGTDLEPCPGEDLEAKLRRLEPHIFDPDVEPLQVNQSMGDDIIATSSVDLYAPGMTQELLESIDGDWSSRLNVRFDLEDGVVTPRPYRIGGVYSRDLETVSFFLERALEHAESPDQEAGLRALLEFYRTGEEEKFRDYSVHWLRSRTAVDYLNGFIESYKDPRGVIGMFEANVSFVADSSLIDALADNALYFEERMPWPEKYRRTRIEKPIANVVRVLVETGDAGPSSPAAYNLPNYNDLRRDVGSKNIVLENIEGARSLELQEAVRREFYLPHLQEVHQDHGDTARRWIVYMHEVIGHGSGQPEPNLGADPAVLVGRAYSALEECRADLVALYHMSDPKLVEIGAFAAEEQPAIVLSTFARYLQGMMVSYRTVKEPEIREAHMRGRQVVLSYLTRGGESGDEDFGVQVVRRDGDYFVDVTDLDRARRGVGELLERLQTIKSTGDAAAAAEMFDRFGSRLDPEIHRNIVERARRLRIPRHTAFVFPRLIPLTENGEVVDARLVSDEDLTAQQLRFSRLRGSREIE